MMERRESTKTKVSGIGGTGKTEKLISLIINGKIDVEEVGFVTFSRRARWNALKRMEKLGVPTEKLKHFRTFHSLSSRLLELHKENFVKTEHRKEFIMNFKKNIPFNSLEDAETDENGILLPETFGSEKALGNWLFNLYIYCNMSKLKGIEREKSISNEIKNRWGNITQEFINEFFFKWEIYKEQNRLYEYCDCIKACYEAELVPPIKILIVDEFQDISPLVYDLYSLWASYVDTIIIAGDPNQNVYKFAGAKERYFFDEKVDEIIELKKNYRVPSKILIFAEEVLNKKIDCVSLVEGGIIRYESERDAILDEIETQTQNSQALFRTKYHLKLFAGWLNKRNIPYTIWGGACPFTESFMMCWEVLHNIKNNKETEAYLVSGFLERIPSKNNLIYGIKNKVKKTDKTYNATEIYNLFNLNYPTINEMISLLKGFNDKQKEILTNLIIMNIKPIKYENIKIHLSTITSSKGGETDVVYLFDNLTRRVYDAIIESEESYNDERNLFYTAITRAKKELVVINDLFDTYTFEPLSQP